MFEDQTWGELFCMLRDMTRALGRAPRLNEVKGSMLLVNSLRHGGWYYVLGYAGIYPRSGDPKKKRFPMFLDDFTEDQLRWLVKSSAWKKGATPIEKDVWYYPELIRRYGSWPEAMAAFGMNLHPDYKPYNPLPFEPELFFDSPVLQIRNITFETAERDRGK